MKKILAVLASLIMVLAMGMTTFAANITIKGGANGSQYAAYKLLNVTDGGEGKYAYTLNDKYLDALQKVTGKTEERDIVNYISELTAEETRTFADAVYTEIKDVAPEAVTDTDKFENMEQGYYLIAEKQTGDAQDTYSLVMLDTAGKEDVEVTTKEDKPELEKKVKEKNDSTGAESDWQDGADYDIGDEVPFQLTGTVEKNYDNYNTYYYAFHDTMSEGLTFQKDSVKVSVDGTVLDSGYQIVTDGLTDGDTFEVRFTDLKEISSVKAGSKITVAYSAILNSNAIIGAEGNPNKAKLEYSNNPYGDGTGETPEDKVVVFTYELEVNKVDKEGNALEGAGFTLYKYDDKLQAYQAVGEEIFGVTTFNFSGQDAGLYKLVETTVPDGYNKADDTIFSIEAEYDTNADNPKLTKLVIRDEDGNVISDGEDAVFTINLAKGTASTDVVNVSGTELPSTGGIGTKIFYSLGGVLMFGAATLIVVRKRGMKAE